VAERQEMAQRFGADASYDPFDISEDEFRQTDGEFDVVIEATGVQSAIDLCTELVAEHGRIILVGYHQSNDGLRTVNMQQWNFKAIDVVNGHVRRHDEKLAAMQEGMDLLAQGHLATEPLVTTYEFAKIESAFRDLTNNRSGLFKAVLLFND
jgi:threonine dehydrogenase-like Zn-dependent dehydrogenase